MKGLLVKDMYLLLQRRQTLLLFIGVSVFMAFTMEDPAFIAGYVAMLGAIVALGTISYDDAENGMPFLLTLPVSRKQYALSKYVLGLVMCTGAALLSIVLLFAVACVQGTALTAEDLLGVIACLPVAMLMMDLMVPLQIRFGAERSRIVLMIAAGAVAAIAMLSTRGVIDPKQMENAFAAVAAIPMGVIIACGAAAWIILTAVSVFASVKIMENKVF